MKDKDVLLAERSNVLLAERKDVEFMSNVNTLGLPKASMELANLPEPLREKALDLATKVNPMDVNSVLLFGLDCQSRISQFSDTMLSKVRMNEMDAPTGQLLIQLVEKLDELDPQSISPKLSKLPVVGSMFMSVKKFGDKFKHVLPEVDSIVIRLKDSQTMLLRDSSFVQELAKNIQEYLQQLSLYAAAGSIALENLQNEIAARSSEIDEHQMLELQQAANRLGRRVHDFKLSAQVAMQMIPQLAMMEGNNQMLIEKIHNVVHQTIPLWKVGFTIALNLEHQKDALLTVRAVTDTTNQLLMHNAKMLKENVRGIATETERGIVDLETLKSTHQDTIFALRDLIQIQQEGSIRRQQAETELLKMQADFRNEVKNLVSSTQENRLRLN